MAEAEDTARRSLAHWSEDRRAGMDAFYRLATEDYRHLAEAVDWRAWLEARQAAAGDRPMWLIDVACGSGKFPAALRRHAGVEQARVRPIAYSLLDPSTFSLAEARSALGAPFEADEGHESTLEGLDPDVGAFDIAWATHALYAVPQASLDAAMARFLDLIGLNGAGFIANAMADSHYIRFYDAFLDAFHEGRGERYRTAEEIVAALDRLGAKVETREIAYAQTAGDDATVEGYLQRCAFDDTVSLERMRATEPVASYLAGCRDEAGGWRFEQRVALIFIPSY
ncbi:MAG: class I SAM-dependent methyltransferase [Paracoccaceae bacterium]